MLFDPKWDVAQDQSPTFKRRWWHSSARLDIRPVLWSLKKHPEEWAFRGEFTIRHEPSAHEFWIGNGLFFYSLYDANCSCTSVSGGRFSLIQKVQFAIAYRRWRRGYTRSIEHPRIAEINRQFAEHFLTSRNG